jgi:hypothetical protein
MIAVRDPSGLEPRPTVHTFASIDICMGPVGNNVGWR